MSKEDAAFVEVARHSRVARDEAACLAAKASLLQDQALENAVTYQGLAIAEAQALGRLMLFRDRMRHVPILGSSSQQLTRKYFKSSYNPSVSITTPLLLATEPNDIGGEGVISGWQVTVHTEGKDGLISSLMDTYDRYNPKIKQSPSRKESRHVTSLVLSQLVQSTSGSIPNPITRPLSLGSYSLAPGNAQFVGNAYRADARHGLDPDGDFCQEQFYVLRAIRLELDDRSLKPVAVG